MVKLIITDFDGTLVDTFEANYRAYAEAFSQQKLDLSREFYLSCFGCRFDDFMDKAHIDSPAEREAIRESKRKAYPHHFHLLKVNKPLIALLKAHHESGGLTAIASTARRENLMAALETTGLAPIFDAILTADTTLRPKPAPDIYLEAMRMLDSSPEQTLVFEDTQRGIEAAESAGASVIQVTKNYF